MPCTVIVTTKVWERVTIVARSLFFHKKLFRMDNKFYGYKLVVPYPSEGFFSYHHYSEWCRRNKIFPSVFVTQVVSNQMERKIVITGLATVL